MGTALGHKGGSLPSPAGCSAQIPNLAHTALTHSLNPKEDPDPLQASLIL